MPTTDELSILLKSDLLMLRLLELLMLIGSGDISTSVCASRYTRDRNQQVSNSALMIFFNPL